MPDAAPPAELPPAALFQGDTGALPLDTRRVLVQLLSGPFLDGERHSRLWPVLLRDEAVLRARLSELFLELVLDRDARIAFTRQAEAGEVDAPLLLRRAQLTFIDSILVLYLRQRLTEADAHGERAAVSADDMVEQLNLYQRAASTDRAGFAKRVHASIEKMKKHSILQKIRGSDERYEVSPTLKLLFTADDIQALTGLYRALLSGAAHPAQPLDDEEAEAP